MNKSRFVSLFLCLGLVPFAVLSMAANKCGSNEDDDKVTPTAAPTPTPTPLPTVEVGPEDAGIDAEDADAADADADAKPVGVGDPTGVRACCAALRQNAKSAPLQQQGAYLLAAGACDAMINNPQGRQGLASLRGMLGGAGMPAACK